jgi:hypothetical protein
MELLSVNAILGAVGFGFIGVASYWLISKAIGLVPALKNEADQQKRLRANAALLKMLRGFHYFGFPVIGFVLGPQVISKLFG